MKVDAPGVLAALGIEYRDKGGGDLWAACPHPGHNEKEASWHLDAESGLQHCFGCGREGDAVDLVASVIGITIGGALQWIRDNGLDREGTPSLNLKVMVGGMLRSFKLPEGLGGGELEEWPTPVRRYALSRGIAAWQVRRWGLLYATDGRLAGRIVFPIRDAAGVLLGYTARSFTGEEPRYKNPHWTERPSASAIFGEQYWRGEELVVTEGAINGLAFERVGVPAFGALGGSDLTAEQVLKLSKFARIVVATDSDAAGEKIAAVLRGALGRWVALGRATFPPKRDAQTLSPEELRQVWFVARHGDWPTLPTRP